MISCLLDEGLSGGKNQESFSHVSQLKGGKIRRLWLDESSDQTISMPSLHICVWQPENSYFLSGGSSNSTFIQGDCNQDHNLRIITDGLGDREALERVW